MYFICLWVNKSREVAYEKSYLCSSLTSRSIAGFFGIILTVVAIMYIHQEGRKLLSIVLILWILLNVLAFLIVPKFFLWGLIASTILFIFIIAFFRNPNRDIAIADNQLVYAPADGKVVVIEETMETEYFKEPRIQVSIFMSPTNVHVNRNPISGTINYFKYHPGKYLVAWHPKSSSENERTTVVIDSGKAEILLRQIAGAMAKRIVNYVEEGQKVVQGHDMGFIKFGSRVDLFLPLNADIQVQLNQKVKGNQTIIAKLAGA